MRKVHDLLNEYLDFLATVVEKVCLAEMAIMTGIELLQVVARLTPGVKNPNWTEELSRYVMIYIAFIGASNGIRQWDNVGVDFLIERLPRVPQFLLNIVHRLVVLAFWCIVTYWGVEYFPKVGARQFSASMGFPILYAQISLIIGGVLCTLQTMGQILNLLFGGGEDA